MKRLFIALLVCGLCFLGVAVFGADLPDANALFEQVKTDLRNKGMDTAKIESASGSIKDLLSRGVNKDQAEKFLQDLYNKDLDKTAFKSSVASLDELMKNGEKFKQAKNLVSSTVKDAQAQGLNNKEITKKVCEVMQERKVELQDLKKQLQEKGNQTKESMIQSAKEMCNKTMQDISNWWGSK
ncbi:MAG: hypothetical protein ABSB18_05660 [Candidatus Omnitrophota bacterium]